MNRPSRTNAGFTLIELIASAVLTAILMTALLNVVWSVSRESSRLRASETTHFPVTQLAQQLRLDFQNARGMVVQAGGVTLHGFVGAQTQLIPGRVQYATQRVAGRQLLICRRGKEPADPVWIDFGGLIVEPLESDESDDGL
ncbi:MAG: type II secretion system protein J, partial [Rubripirellula sp.]